MSVERTLANENRCREAAERSALLAETALAEERGCSLSAKQDAADSIAAFECFEASLLVDIKKAMEEVHTVDLAVARRLNHLKASLFECNNAVREEDWVVDTTSITEELCTVCDMSDTTSLVAHADKTWTNGAVMWCGHHLIVGGTPTPLQMKARQRYCPRCHPGKWYGPQAPNPLGPLLCGHCHWPRAPNQSAGFLLAEVG